MMRSAVYVLLVALSFAFFEADANKQSFRLESRSVVRKRRAILNNAEQAEVVKAHNDVRRLEGSSNMEIMRWNEDLATMSEAWAQKCEGDHGQAIEPPSSLGSSRVGQNLFASFGGSSLNVTSVTLIWYDEKGFYNYGTGECQPNQVCGHYTQVVWADTKLIGCAYVTCATLKKTEMKNAIFFVCNYAPPGNFIGQQAFKMGDACTECASSSGWCNAGLCDGSCSIGKPGCSKVSVS